MKVSENRDLESNLAGSAYRACGVVSESGLERSRSKLKKHKIQREIRRIDSM